MPNGYSSGGSSLVEGASRAFEEITVQELTENFAPLSRRPAWMRDRHPVSHEEFEELNAAAAVADPPDLSPMAVGTDATTADADDEAAATAEESPEGEDPVAAAPVTLAPAIGQRFEGIPQTNFHPPDCTTAVGPNDVMVAVNTDLAVYSKGGVLKFRWPNMNTLFSKTLPKGATLFDPRVAYDHYDERWIVVVAAQRGTPEGSWHMLAVSQGTDPKGPYWTWALDATLNGGASTNNWADYPQLGFDTQGIYISSNMFEFSGSYQYAKLRILQKKELYGGGSGSGHNIKWYDFWDLKNPDGSSAYTVQPAVHFRGTRGNPPAYLVNSIFPGGSTLTLWTLTNPVGYWSGSSPSLANESINCASYSQPPDGIQPGTNIRIETNDTRLLNAVYQYRGNTRRLWTSQTAKHTWPGENEARSVVQWFEIDVASKSIAQQNRYGAAGKYYYYPAIQTDFSRNAYIVFGRSGEDEFAQVRQTGRKVGDTPNDMQNSVLIKNGESSYKSNRWGDYYGICRDGGDASTVWMYGEYADAGNNWGTYVASAKF